MRFFRPLPRLGLAQPADAEDLARLWAPPADLAGSRLGAELSPDPAEVAAWLRGGFEIHRASLDGRLVGAVRCCFPVSTCYVDRLAVAPGDTGRGFGRYLLEHAVSRARRAGVSRVWTSASPQFETAVRLLRDLDFTITARQRLAAGDEELLLFELTL